MIQTVWSPCSKCGIEVEKVLYQGKEYEMHGACKNCIELAKHKKRVKENIAAMKEAFKDPEIIKMFKDILKEKSKC